MRFIISLFAVTLTSALFAEDARSIVDGFEAKKAEALAAYLEGNPDAEDAEMARMFLIGSYLELEENEKVIPLLRDRYDALPKGAEANLQELIGGAIEPLFQLYVESGQKEEAKALLEEAKVDLAENPQAPQIAQFFDQMLGELQKPSVGETMEVSFTSTQGEEVNLADLKGKVVLVDFWATWCGPCVAKMPSILSTYEQYKADGFEVVGISLDDDRASLDQFIEQNKIPWPQMFDGKAWDNEFAQKFGISGIPATFLIGKDGKIAATNLMGDELNQKVGELLQ